MVERLDAFEGLLILSLPGVVQKADWGSLAVGQVVEARCVGMNKGGLEMEVAHHRGFMPAGQVDIRSVPDISIFLGEKFPCKVLELRKDKNRLVLSRKAAQLAEREAARGSRSSPPSRRGRSEPRRSSASSPTEPSRISAGSTG